MEVSILCTRFTIVYRWHRRDLIPCDAPPAAAASGKKESVKPESETKPSRSREQDKPVSEPEEQKQQAPTAAKRGKGSATKAKVREVANNNYMYILPNFFIWYIFISFWFKFCLPSTFLHILLSCISSKLLS